MLRAFVKSRIDIAGICRTHQSDALPKLSSLFESNPHARICTNGYSPSQRFFASPSNARSGSRQRLVILGTGWAASSLAKHVDTSKFAITVVSQLNHMVFTPLLPGAAVGSVEGRSTALNIAAIQPELKRRPHAILQATALSVDPAVRKVACVDDAEGKFDVDYDLLAIATGSQGSTFGTPGVEEHAHFLRNVSQALAIRRDIIRTFTLAFSPGQSEKEKHRLLQTLIVGGGPTGVEFAGELCDFIQSELRAFDGYRAGQAKVIIVEAQELLSNFDSSLRNYAVEKLKKQGIQVIEGGLVKELTQTEAKLSNGEVIPYGVCVWSTGVGPTEFISKLPFSKTAKGRLAVDKYLRVLDKSDVSEEGHPKQIDEKAEEHKEEEQKRSQSLDHVEGTFALGDCCANIGTALPALAQVAEQQGRYLAQTLNNGEAAAPSKPFVWKQLGSMANLGNRSAIIELGAHGSHINWKGFTSYIAWKSAYFSKLYTTRNRIQILVNWISTAIWGRDISRW